MVQLYCATLYLFSPEFSLVFIHRLTLDQYPKTHSSKHERGHTNTSLALTHEKLRAALIMLAEETVGMPFH